LHRLTQNSDQSASLCEICGRLPPRLTPIASDAKAIRRLHRLTQNSDQSASLCEICGRLPPGLTPRPALIRDRPASAAVPSNR
jgi:hypothetical protein